ncbi:MAG: hypothetical protein V3T30_02355, partial [Thermodesulfobacteriota bacterium]
MPSIFEYVSRHKVKLALAAILILAVFFRFYKLTELPPAFHVDEAINGIKSRQALLSGDFKFYYEIRSLASINEDEEFSKEEKLTGEFLSSSHRKHMHETFGREGLYTNFGAISMWIFGDGPWSIRAVSAFFGAITVLGLFLMAREIFFRIEGRGKDPSTAWLPPPEVFALLAAFFLAVSFWHVNFSRIGYRAILTPAVTVFLFYFLFKGLRGGRAGVNFLLAGALSGVGFHTYT